MADQKLQIQIETTATGQGVQQTAAGLKDVAGAAKQVAPAMDAAGKGSKQMADGLGKSVAVGSATTALLQNLSQVGQGGAAGMFAFGRSIVALGQVIKAVLVGTGPIGIAIAALGLLAGAAFALRDAFKPAGESAEEMARRIATLNKAKLDAITQQEKALTEATKEATDAIEKQLIAADKLADLRTARLIEEEKARGKEQGITPEITDRNITRIRRDAEDAKLGRDLSAAEQKARVLEDSASEAEQKRLTADAQRNYLLTLKKTYDDLSEEEARTRKEMLKGYLKRGYALPEENEKLSELQRQQTSARDALDKRLGGKDNDGTLYAGALKTADEVLRTTTEASQAAAKAAETATAAAAEARSDEGKLKPERDKLRTAEDRNAAGQTTEQKAAQEKEVERLKRQSRSTVDNQVASGGYTNEGAYVEAFGRAAWEKYSPAARAGAAQSAAQTGVQRPDPSGGTIIGPDGQVINTAAARQATGPSMIGPDGRPVAVQSGQPAGPGRGAYREGQDGAGGAKKAGDEIATAMGDAKKSTEATGEGMDAAAKATKDFAEAQTAANEQISTTFSTQAEVMSTLTFGVSELADAVTRAIERIKRLEAQAKEAAAKARAAKVQ